MARGINKVILVGHLGQDPDTRYTQDGRAISNISIATTESWKDKQTGEKRDKTEWHRVVIFGKLAEIAKEYLHKGSLVYIEGKLQTRKWQDKSGQDRYTTEIVIDFNGTMNMLDSKSGGTSNYNPAPQQQAAAPQENNAPAAPAADLAVDDFDDDIPF